jgi:predicted nucleotidyltransferase
MHVHSIEFPEARIADFCRRHGVQRLSLFGSILREDFRPDSDVDVLVEFLPERTPGMFGFGQMIIELREIIKHDVDLRTPEDLSMYFRNEVLRDARLLHAA